MVPIVDVSSSTTKRTTVSGLATAVASNLPDSSIPAVKLSNVWWEELGRSVASTATSSLSVSLSSAKDNLMIIVTSENATSGPETHAVTFNNDASINYARNQVRVNAGATSVLNTNVASIAQLGYTAVTQTGELTVNVGRAASTTKTKSANVNSATSVDARYGFANWLNTTQGITSVQLNSSNTNGIASGSTIIVLGRN